MKTPEILAKAVVEYQNGNADAFQTIYEESYKYLHTCTIHVMKDEDLAQDMLQETYMEVVKNIGQLKNAEDFLSWAAVIANRKCFAAIKKDRDVLVDEQDEEQGDYFENIADSEEIIPEEVLQNREKQILIKNIIDELSDMQRLCVIGFYYNEQKQEEIAEELGIPVSTVKSHLNRAKGKIKEAVIELDTKKGTRLYSFAPFFLLFFMGEAKDCMAAPMSEALLKEVEELATKNGGSTVANKTVTKVAADEVANTAKVASKALGIKIALGVIGGAALIGGVAYIATNSHLEEEEIVENVDVEAVEEAEDVVTEDIDTADEETEEADVEVDEDVLDENFLENHLFLEVSCADFPYVVFGDGGVIVVGNDYGYGAIDYDGNEIVPCQYESYKLPNKKGFVVFGDGDNNHLFDNTGKEIVSTAKDIMATGNFYILYDGSDVNTEYAYYTYDGAEVYKTSYEEGFFAPAGSFEDKVSVYKFAEDGDSVTENVGILSADGSIAWNSNPLYDGPAIIMHESNSSATDMNGDGIYMSENAASSSSPLPHRLAGAMNGGYYILENTVAEYGVGTMYDENNQEVFRFYYPGMHLSGGGIETDRASENYDNAIRNMVYDGARLANYGSKVVFAIDGKQVLVDGKLAKGQADFDYSIPKAAVLGVYDQINMKDTMFWGVRDGDNYFYIDHDGKKVSDNYAVGTSFCSGYALVLDNDQFWMINEKFEKVQLVENPEDGGEIGALFELEFDGVHHFYQF